MGIRQLDHYFVRTPDLARAIRVYEAALGFHPAPGAPQRRGRLTWKNTRDDGPT